MFYLWSKGRDFSPSLLGIITDLKKKDCIELLRLSKRLGKLLKLEILERCVLGVRMGKSGPLERVRLVNQIQGFRIPNR